MDINVLVDDIKKDIGLVGVMAGTYNDAVIRDSILTRSLNEFNRWSGFIIDMRMDGILDNFKEQFMAQNGVDLVIVLPDDLIQDLQQLNCEIKRAYVGRIPQFPISGYFYSRGMKDDLPIYKMQQDLRNNYENPKWTFRAPNTIMAKDYGRYSFRSYAAWQFHFECTHPTNLSTITKGLEYSFFELCKLDIMINMWNNELRFMHADIGSATLDPDVLENFRNAESARTDLIANLRKKNALDHIDFIF